MTFTPANSHANGQPLGLTGATAATRYVGATAAGAPATGTFAVGDFVVDQSGKVFVCTVAGSPGTWATIGASAGSVELLYVQRVTNLAVSATTAAGATSWIDGTSLTFDGTTRIKVECFAPIQNAVVFVNVNLWQDATDLGVIAGSSGGATNPGGPLPGERYLTPAAGAKVYSLKAWRGATSATIYGGSGGVAGEYLPAFLRISTAPAA